MIDQTRHPTINMRLGKRTPEGEVVDVSPNYHRGIVHGNPEIVIDPVFGECLMLNTGGDFVEIPFHPSLQPERALTLEAWIKPRTISGPSAIVQYPHTPGQNLEPFYEWGIYLESGLIETRIDSDALIHDPSTQPAIFTDQWHHVAVTWDSQDGLLCIYIDGRLLEDQELSRDRIPYMFDNSILIGRNAVGGDGFNGTLANIRLYDRALSQAQIQIDMEEDRRAAATYRHRHPFNLQLIDDDGIGAVYIVEDEVPGKNLHVVIINRFDHAIELPKLSDDAAGPDNYHFELRFRPGCLAEESIDQLSLHESNWRLTRHTRGDGTVSLYMLRDDPVVMQPNRRIALTLGHVKASTEFGADATRVELRFEHLRYVAGGATLAGHRLHHIRIINHRGRRYSPLRLSVLGSRTILNDGVADNQLTLRLRNTSYMEPVEFDASKTRLILWFDDGVLGRFDQVDKILVELPGWEVRQTVSRSPHWTLVPAENDRLEASSEKLIKLSNIITSHPAGLATAHLHFENVPGYWDGELTCEIEKGPLLYRNDPTDSRRYNVGVRTSKPSSSLHIGHGNEASLTSDGHFLIGLASDENLVFDTTTIQARKNGAAAPLYLQPSGGSVVVDKIQSSSGQLLIDDGVQATGLVGISTPDAKSPLSVAGGTAIGTTYAGANIAPDSGLIVEGSVGIGIPTTASKLAVSGNTSIGSNFAQRAAPGNGMIIEGAVGIGTPTPKAKLTVNGGIHIGGDSDPGARNLQVDGTLLIGGDSHVNQTDVVARVYQRNLTDVDETEHKNLGKTLICEAVNAGIFRITEAKDPDEFGNRWTGKIPVFFWNEKLVRVMSPTFWADGDIVVHNRLGCKTLDAVKKNFSIPHPTKPHHSLVHACLEGPENGVYYRGTARLENGEATIRLPEYFEALTRLESRTVQLTAKGKIPFLLSYEDIENGRFHVHGTQPDGEFAWEVKAVRVDIDELVVEVPVHSEEGQNAEL